MLNINNIEKSFEKGKKVLKNLSLVLKNEEIVSLLGSSGCGKTTLLRIIAGFEYPDQGSIELARETVVDTNIFVPPDKRHVGIVFQQNTLFPHLNVVKNICFGISKDPKKLQAEKLNEMLALFSLHGNEHQFPHQLSGGQQRRVAIARTLITNPRLLLLDEPFVNLDENLRNDLIHDIKDILKTKKVTTIFVTHDINDAIYLGDEIAVIDNGQIIQKGTPEILYTEPNNLKVAEIFGKIYLISIKDNISKYVRAENVELTLKKGILNGRITEIVPSGKIKRVSIEIAPNISWWVQTEEHVEIRQEVGLTYDPKKLISLTNS